jgi:hypothetical protein
MRDPHPQSPTILFKRDYESITSKNVMGCDGVHCGNAMHGWYLIVTSLTERFNAARQSICSSACDATCSNTSNIADFCAHPRT